MGGQAMRNAEERLSYAFNYLGKVGNGLPLKILVRMLGKNVSLRHSHLIPFSHGGGRLLYYLCIRIILAGNS